MIKAIIFDFGSVIYKTDWKSFSKEFFDNFGFEIAIAETKDQELIRIYKDSDIGKEDYKKFFLRLNPNIKDLDEVLDFYKKGYGKHKKVNEELVSLIKELKKKYLLIGFTDIKKEHYAANVESGIYRGFERIFTSFEFGVLKSDEKAFELLKKELEKLELEPKECIFIDDHLPNIENAKNFGFETIHYTEFPEINKLKKELDLILKK